MRIDRFGDIDRQNGQVAEEKQNGDPGEHSGNLELMDLVPRTTKKIG